MSPDGQQVYATSWKNPVIRIFDRQPDNSLVPRSGPTGCYTQAGGTCTSVPGLGTAGYAYDLAVSADGLSVYVVSFDNLVALRRDPASGVLTFAACYGPGAGFTAVANIGGVQAVVVSPEGNQVYARPENGLLVFDRNPSTSTLTVKAGALGCLRETATAGCTDSYGLGGRGYELAVTADGRFLYASTQGGSGGISFFVRAADGTLSQISGPTGGCITATGASTAGGECMAMTDGQGAPCRRQWRRPCRPQGSMSSCLHTGAPSSSPAPPTPGSSRAPTASPRRPTPTANCSPRPPGWGPRCRPTAPEP